MFPNGIVFVDYWLVAFFDAADFSNGEVFTRAELSIFSSLDFGIFKECVINLLV